jgi:O-acetyl-ADP-ribose deacetylase (regulator of RNase III)
MTVDIIVCPQDDNCLSKGGIAKVISKDSNEWYRTAVSDMKIVKKCEVRKIRASPTSLPYKGVLHTVAPRWDKHAVIDNKTFMKELSLTTSRRIETSIPRR